jgi:GT2 family glycosyltransferase
MKIAILLTTFNRKEKTIACLRSLKTQQLPVTVSLDTYLTDDNSSDGTREAVHSAFPEVKVFKGSGSLYWAGGMRNSWRQALNSGYDQYLLLNDDTVLHPDAIAKLIDYNAHQESPKDWAICIGNTCDETNKITYGGKRLNSKFSVDSSFVFSEDSFVECDMGNANIMLVPDYIVQKIGILSDAFTHGIADYDYTLKARKAGFNVLTAPGFLGICKHDHPNNWKSAGSKLKDRLAFLKSPKGLAYHEYLSFTWNHFPVSYPAIYTKLWLKTFFPILWDTFKR